MAELNFGLLNPPGSQSIGNAFVTGMDQARASQMQDMQMQQSQRQGEVTQMQLAKLRRDEQGLADFSKKVAAMGGPSDPVAIAQAYLGHPDVEMQKLGAGLMQKAQTLALYKERYPTAAPATPPAAAAPSQPPAAAMGDFLGAGNQLMPGVQANALAPAPATTNALAPATTNALAPAPATVETRLADIRAQLAKLDPFIGPNGVPEAIRQEEQLKEEYKALITPRVIAPGGTILRPGLPDYTAPAAKSEFETLLANSGLSEAEKTAARQARVGKEATTSYEFLSTLAQLGKTTDPYERGQLKNRLTQLSTHPLPTQLKVNTFVPASEEAQKEFMRETRTTYGALKQSPAMFANIEAAKKLIPSARAFMGAGGEGMKTAASFLNSRLGMNINTEGVKDATELQSRLFQGIMDNLKKLDAQPSERQQAALKEALGSLSTDPNALPNVLDAFADSVRSKIDVHNAEVQSAISRGVKFPYDPIIKVPAKATAGNVTTNPQFPGFSIGER